MASLVLAIVLKLFLPVLFVVKECCFGNLSLSGINVSITTKCHVRITVFNLHLLVRLCWEIPTCPIVTILY